MKNLTACLVIGAILGSSLGFTAGILAFPYLFGHRIQSLVADVAPATGAPGGADPIARGAFIHADPSDPNYYGSGGVTLYPELVLLESDFEVGPGPKYHLYLVRDADITPLTRVEESMFVDLGPLRAFRGRQGYPIPPGTDPGGYDSVVVWSEHFNLLVSPARLETLKTAE